MTIITRDYLESLLVKNTDVLRVVKKIEESIDRELVENTGLYNKIEAFVPIYSKYFNSKYKMNISSSELTEVQESIKDLFKRKGFNIFLLNRRSYDDICLVITNKISYKDMVSQPIKEGSKPIYEEGLRV